MFVCRAKKGTISTRANVSASVPTENTPILPPASASSAIPHALSVLAKAPRTAKNATKH